MPQNGASSAQLGREGGVAWSQTWNVATVWKASQNIWLGFVCGPKIYILKPFFFIPGPFQDGHFLGVIIYLSALDLKPAHPCISISDPEHRSTPGIFYTYFRKTVIQHTDLSRSPNGYFKPLLDHGRFISETAVRRFQKRNGRFVTDSGAKQPLRNRFRSETVRAL